MLICITKEDIETCPRGCPQCPGERAVRRALGGNIEHRVAMGTRYLIIDDNIYKIPYEVTEFVHVYEGWSQGKVKPIRFELDLNNPLQKQTP